MIEILTALYPEAYGLIQCLSLKKDHQEAPFPAYKEAEGRIRLTITGTGKMAAAAAAGCVLGRYRKDDLPAVHLVNYGSCAGTQAGLYMVNKITDADTGRTYYPDLVIRHTLPEAALVTGSRPLAGQGGSGTMEASMEAGAGFFREFPQGTLYDMEAAAIYEAGHFFLGPQQMHFLKGVTDAGLEQGTNPSGEDMASEQALTRFRERMTAYAAQAVPIFTVLKEIDLSSGHYSGDPTEHSNMTSAPDTTDTRRRQSFFSADCKKMMIEEENRLDEKISGTVRASVTMQQQIRQLVHYGFLVGTDVESVFTSCCKQFGHSHAFVKAAQGNNICRDRRDGKLLLEQFREALLQDK